MISPYPLDSLRSSIQLLSDWTYLNTGTVGVMAEPVLTAMLGYMSAYERGGHTAQAAAIDSYENARNVLAELLGVDPGDLAFNRNASDGINLIAAGFPLQPGDQVITSSEEHPAMIVPWLAACEKAGATLRYVDVSHEPDRLKELISDALTDQARLVAISHVSCETGTRIPVEVIREAVGDGVSILVDASQSVGQFPVNIPDLNADFVIGNGHKWLAGPKGTGFAWLRPESIDLVRPVYFHGETVNPGWSRDYYQQTPPPPIEACAGAARYEFGTRSWHLYGALADAILYQQEIGWNAIHEHVKHMSDQMKAQLAEIPGVRVITPERWEDSSGIVSFTVEGLAGTEVSSRLWNDYRIAQRRVERPSATRVSATYFTSPADIEALANAVDSLARDG